MKKLIIASAFAVLSTAAFAQEAPYIVWDGQVVFTGQPSAYNGMSTPENRSMASTNADPFHGGNINWDVDYNGR